MALGMRSPVPRGQGPSCHPSAVPTGFLVGGENGIIGKQQKSVAAPISGFLYVTEGSIEVILGGDSQRCE